MSLARPATIRFDQIALLAPSRALARWGEDTLALLGDSEHVLLTGRDVVTVALLIDGRRTKGALLTEAAVAMGDLRALAAFHQLEQSGQICAAPPGASVETTAFWHAMGVEASDATERLRASRLRVRQVGHPDASACSELCQAIRDAGLELELEREPASGTQTAASPPTLEVVLVEDFLDPRLDAENHDHLTTEVPWCLFNPFGAVGWLGPIFRPRRGPCWECVAHRLRANRPVQECLARMGDQRVGAPAANLTASRRLLSNLAATVLARALASPTQSELYEHLLSFDLKTLQPRYHFVARRPHCRACGDPEALRTRAERKFALAPISKSLPHAGGYRRYSAREALERHRRLVSPLVGAVTFLEPLHGRHSALHPVYVSGYLVPPGQNGELDSCVRVCAGKGSSDEQAQMSALSEAVERRSGQYEGDEPRLRASLAELGDDAIGPELLQGFSARQYAERASANILARDATQRIPEPLPRHVPLDWTPAWSLVGSKRCYVPLTYCFSGAPPASGTAYCSPCGNGVAAGTSLEEAILQALLELVERDAVAIWWYNRLVLPEFSHVADNYVRGALAQHRHGGTDVQLLDLTHDLGIPVCAAVRHDAEGGLGLGFGCHLDPQLAAERALTELNQLGDGRHPVSGKPLLDVSRLCDRRFLFSAPRKRAYDVASFDGPHLAADIDECVRRLACRGLEVWVVDKTRPDFGLNVAQVIVPGLRHFWPRFAPGRLFDVPVRLGILPRPHTEAELNDVPLLL
jgi:oxazoline/thiazoline synthase